MSANCAKCDRPLRSARAMRAGYGWRCHARVRRAAEVLVTSGNAAAAKAADILLLAAAVRLPGHRGRAFRVVGSTGTEYITTPESCNCPHGLRHSRTTSPCSHRAAVTILCA